MLIRILMVFALVAAVGLLRSPGFASHPYPGSGYAGDINYLFRDLEPGRSGTISYRLCGDAQDPAPVQWTTGVENWDYALGPTMDFNPVTSCSTNTRAELRWEVGEECGAGNWACWVTADYGQYTTHGAHRDITLGSIAFDRVEWDDFTNDDWRVYTSAHEWGHNMSLADHDGNDCADSNYSLMGHYFTPTTVPSSPCNQGPSANDRDTVRCVVYQRCNETKQGLYHASFEHSSYNANWLLFQPTGGDGGITANRSTSGGARSGTQFLHLYAWDNPQPAGWPGASIYQNIPWDPIQGQSYVFSFWARVPSGCVQVSIYLWAIGGSSEGQPTSKTICETSWTVISAPLDVAGTTNYSSLRAQIYFNTPGNLYIDATEVVQSWANNSTGGNASFERGAYLSWSQFGSPTRSQVQSSTYSKPLYSRVLSSEESGAPSLGED